jgi:hypothetical protein
MSTTNEIEDVIYGKLLAESLPKPIRSDEELARSTAALLALDEREDLSPEEEALAEVLTLLIEDYEEKHHPLPHVPPHESLNSLMEERGLKQRTSGPSSATKGRRRRSWQAGAPSVRPWQSVWPRSSRRQSTCLFRVEIA